MITKQETTCRDLCGLNISPLLLAKLNLFRADFGKPMVVSSGARCPTVNKKAGGRSGSAHLQGRAVDFVRTPELVAFCTEENLAKHGLYMEHPDYTSTWLHLCDRPPPSGRRIFIP